MYIEAGEVKSYSEMALSQNPKQMLGLWRARQVSMLGWPIKPIHVYCRMVVRKDDNNYNLKLLNNTNSILIEVVFSCNPNCVHHRLTQDLPHVSFLTLLYASMVPQVIIIILLGVEQDEPLSFALSRARCSLSSSLHRRSATGDHRCWPKSHTHHGVPRLIMRGRHVSLPGFVTNVVAIS